MKLSISCRLVLLFALVLTNPFVAAATPVYDDFSGGSYTLADGATSPNGKWQNVFNGGGSSGVTTDSAGQNVFFEQPATSTTPSHINPDGTSVSGSHSTLVLTTQTFTDFTLSLDMRTDRQLRLNDPPNPWETAWVMFRYDDRGHHDWFYLGTNHYELGKKDTPVVNGVVQEIQYFLQTGPAPVVTIGDWQHLDLTVIGNHISVSVDGALVLNYVDAGETRANGTIIPPMSNFAGQIGLYTEDAAVSFANVEIAPIASVPEPSTILLMGSMLAGLLLARQRRTV